MEGELIDRQVGHLLEPGEGQPLPRRPAGLGQGVPSLPEHVADRYVLPHGHGPEGTGDLEGAGQAPGGDLVGAELEEVGVVEEGPAAVGGIEAAQHVDQRRLAGTVGTDQSEDLALLDGQLDVIERLHSPEVFADAGCCQQAHGRVPSTLWSTAGTSSAAAAGATTADRREGSRTTSSVASDE